MSVLLRAHELVVAYGQIEAEKGVSFHLNEGEITALVGANGAGKSTILAALSGLTRARQGKIVFRDEDISALPPHEIVRRGVVQVAEGRAILTTLTVQENLDLGAYTRRDRAEIAAMCRRYGVRRLEVFGSAARETDFDPLESDADFLVAFDPAESGLSPLEQYFGLAEALELDFILAGKLEGRRFFHFISLYTNNIKATGPQIKPG